MKYIDNLIALCNHVDVKYHHQSVVVLESTPIEPTAKKYASNYLNDNKVTTILAIERPQGRGQLYIAEGLSTKYHFSCPTMFLPSLVKTIQQSNNNEDLQLIFIPRSTKLFKGKGITVYNDSSVPGIFHNGGATSIVEEVLKSGGKKGGERLGSSGKRSNHSFSIGLQTMYAHQQHSARYSMLPQSMPHVPNVKKHPKTLIESILTVYFHVLKLLEEVLPCTGHPFVMNESEVCNKYEIVERHNLRNDFIMHLQDISNTWHETLQSTDKMFEACTVQPTGALGFQQDLMNCSYMDKTIAFIAPTTTGSDQTYANDKCLTYLFYSRKCVGDHAKKMSMIRLYNNDPKSCKLTKLCLRSMMIIGGVFDYQGSLFEAEESLKDIARRLESDANHICKDVSEFTGLSCFKHGAAFDKLGYYSIFINIFLSLYYNEILINVDDAIGLCMFFGLMCNGTSALAAVWNTVSENERAVKKWLGKRHYQTKLFECLYKLYDKRFGSSRKADGKILYGNCKLQRYQYANHSLMIIDSASAIHDIVKEFMMWRTADGKKKRISTQHGYLYKKLCAIKGVGPIAFNQFWHSMCLCGLLPPSHIQLSTVGQRSGPAKLIQTFHPNIKSPEGLQQQLLDVTMNLNQLGFKKVTEFFVENQLCEVWRIATFGHLFKKGMTQEDKCEAFMDDAFQLMIQNANPTRNPDIYYCNPFTNEYQQLFRVVGKELVMRPLFISNRNTGTVNVHCNISCAIANGSITVNWTGELLRNMGKDPRDLFA